MLLRAEWDENQHHRRAEACDQWAVRVALARQRAVVLNGSSVEAKIRGLVARCTELRSDIESAEGALIDYGQRHQGGEPLSSVCGESTVDPLVSAHMNK